MSGSILVSDLLTTASKGVKSLTTVLSVLVELYSPMLFEGTRQPEQPIHFDVSSA